MEDDLQLCLEWNNHQSTLIQNFSTFLKSETLVDCTLEAEGKTLKAHKIILSACSPFFECLFRENYDKSIFILKDVKFKELKALMDYMYKGKVSGNISRDQLAALLQTAESLQIKGLSESKTAGSSKTESRPQKTVSQSTATSFPHSSQSPIFRKRKRLEERILSEDSTEEEITLHHITSNSSDMLQQMSVLALDIADSTDSLGRSALMLQLQLTELADEMLQLLYEKPELKLILSNKFKEIMSSIGIGLIGDKYLCNNCGHTFTLLMSLLLHRNECNKGRQPYSQNKRNRPRTYKCEKKYECEKCHREYSHLRSLRSHQRKECAPRVEPKFVCNYCNRRYTLKTTMQRHVRMQHH